MSGEVISTNDPAPAPVAVPTPAPAPTPEAAPSGTPAPEGTHEPVETEEQKKIKSMQRAFDRKVGNMTRQFYQEKARADQLEKQYREVSAAAPKPHDPDEPDAATFTDALEYGKAMREYGQKKAATELQTRQQSEMTTQAQNRLVANWEKHVERAEDKYPDFAEKVGDLKPAAPWAIAVMEAENADDVAYYLGTHVDEARRIVGLGPVAQIREIGKIEARLSAAPPKAEVSNAPPPIRPLGGGGATVHKSLSDTTQLEFEKRRRKFIAERNGR